MSIYRSVKLDNAVTLDEGTWDVAVAIFECDDFLRLSYWAGEHEHQIYLTPATAHLIVAAIIHSLDGDT